MKLRIGLLIVIALLVGLACTIPIGVLPDGGNPPSPTLPGSGCPSPVPSGPTPVSCDVPVGSGCPSPVPSGPTPVSCDVPVGSGCPSPVPSGPTPVSCDVPVGSGCPSPVPSGPTPVSCTAPVGSGCPSPVPSGPTPISCGAPVGSGCPSPVPSGPTPVTCGSAPKITLTINANCHTGPSLDYSSAAIGTAGKSYFIEGLSADYLWYYVNFDGSLRCWFGKGAGSTSGDLSGLPLGPGSGVACSSFTEPKSCNANASCQWITTPRGSVCGNK